MSSNTTTNSIISLTQVGKCYQIYRKPHHRLLQMLARRSRTYFREFWALQDINLEIKPGEVFGIIGCNGAGKSTLLQLMCGTLTPSHGHVDVQGRIAALLELGAGFNPEFTGRENVYLSATIAGMSRKEIDDAFDSIVEFAGIGPFIDQPVKTFSSGMYVRLAFSVAINVDPDILIIDEALSVGDGDFSRKSFERIMHLKDAGKTIIFCSHAMYQVEALCDRAMWLDKGNARQIGSAATVISSYTSYLDTLRQATDISQPPQTDEASLADTVDSAQNTLANEPMHKICSVFVQRNCEDRSKSIEVQSQADKVTIHVEFTSSLAAPPVNLGIALTDVNNKIITSFSTYEDKVDIRAEQAGVNKIAVVLPDCPLLKGQYLVYVFLLCERAIHVYDHAHAVADISVTQNTWLQGVVVVPHKWVLSQ